MSDVPKIMAMVNALKEISNRVDELETANHRAVDFVEVRALQEIAEDALRKVGTQ